jgi:hypothetical protein
MAALIGHNNDRLTAINAPPQEFYPLENVLHRLTLSDVRFWRLDFPAPQKV